MDPMDQAARTVSIGIVLAAVYFLPTVIVLVRNHRNGAAISVLNLFLGWTFIGWVIALVWSLTAPPPAD